MYNDFTIAKSFQGCNDVLRLVTCYKGMLRRCLVPEDSNYQYYGERGIDICHRWLGRQGLVNFILDMGVPDGAQSIDRINNDMGYSPENCRWTDNSTQQRNRRDNYHVIYKGESYLLIELAEKYNLFYPSVVLRMKRGWDIERCIDTPTPKSWDDYLHRLQEKREHNNKTINRIRKTRRTRKRPVKLE